MLTGPDLATPLTDSAAMARWLSSRYPRLLPMQHAEVIQQAVATLYSFDMVSLTTLEHDQTRTWMHNGDAILDVLQLEGISADHRRLLEDKLQRYVGAAFALGINWERNAVFSPYP